MSIKSIIGVLLIMAALTGMVGGIDYKPAEDLMEDVLIENTPGVYKPDVTITDDLVILEYQSLSFTANQMALDIAGVVGAYWGIVNYYSDVGDLEVKIKTVKNEVIGTYSCKKAWVENLDIEDEDALLEAIMKAMATVKAKE